MILQKLHDDCDTILKQTTGETLPPSGYIPKAVRWIIDLRDGKAPIIESNASLDVAKSKKDRGATHLLPEYKRSGTVVRPFLLADVATYVLGVNLDPGKTDNRLAAKHEAFVLLARRCATRTGNARAAMVADFLEAYDPQNPPFVLPAELDATHVLSFKANGKWVVDEPEIQAFWAGVAAREAELQTDAEPVLALDEMPTHREPMCLLSGARGKVEEMMPLTVRGLAGGNPTGTHIVSGNFAAMESHGWTRAESSPIARAAGERFGQSLNALLASPRHYRRLAASTYVFWAGETNTALDVLALDAEPSPEKIEKLLAAAHTGVPYYANVAATDAPFYVFGLLPNVARIAVRTALTLKVGELESNERDWFPRLQVPAFDERGQPMPLKPLPIKTLSVAGYREFRDVPPQVEDALVRCALEGCETAPLPLSLLYAVVLRCRAEQAVTYPRAALIKFIVTQDKERRIADIMQNEVNDTLPEPFTPPQNAAYQLGRLFAELEEVQSQAIPGANATIADRFYGSASSTPASVFGTLLDGAQNHLSKLRKDRPGAHAGAQKRIEEILAQVSDFPKTLTLPDQALFSLGYYHHRAAKRKEISERSAAKRAAQAAGMTVPTEAESTNTTDTEGTETE